MKNAITLTIFMFILTANAAQAAFYYTGESEGAECRVVIDVDNISASVELQGEVITAQTVAYQFPHEVAFYGGEDTTDTRIQIMLDENKHALSAIVSTKSAFWLFFKEHYTCSNLKSEKVIK